MSGPPPGRLAIRGPGEMKLSKEEVMVTKAIADRGTSVRRLVSPALDG